ncbi:hypothetical protein [Halarchaeum salinum]
MFNMLSCICGMSARHIQCKNCGRRTYSPERGKCESCGYKEGLLGKLFG